jgi:hypothetical protein
VPPGQVEPGQPDVDADVPVAQRSDVRTHQAPAATEIDQDGAVARGGRDVLRPPGGEPVQGRELAVRLPPLLGQVVVLGGVVAGAPPRDHGVRTGSGRSSEVTAP